MLEALYSVSFWSNATVPNPAGGGIVVLETGRVLGGDISYTYIGEFRSPRPGIAEADVEVRKYRDFPGQMSIFGPAEVFNLKLEGPIARDSFRLEGHVVQNPALRITVEFTRRAELP